MTEHVTGGELAQRLADRLPGAVVEVGDTAVWVEAERIVDVMKFLKEEPGLEFNFLNAITAVDYVDHFETLYHITSLTHNRSAVVKARVYGRDEPSIPSVYDVWQGADYQEREIWDLMGIRFPGHPNHKRIMLWDGFPGHPLRKDFQDVVEY